MKIAVFATGWNGEYLRDMYHGLENSQKEFHDSIHLYASFGRLGSGDSFNKSEFDFFELADMEVVHPIACHLPTINICLLSLAVIGFHLKC